MAGSKIIAQRVVLTFPFPQVHYAEQDHYYSHDGDSSMNSSQVSVGIDDYLDEALVGDYASTQEDDTEDEHNASQLSLGVSTGCPTRLLHYS